METSQNFVPTEELYRRNTNLKKEDIEHLSEWVKRQQHLPHIPERKLIALLHSCYYSLERTKKCIEKYCTFRAHAPEFFSNLDPCSTELENAWNIMDGVDLPNKDADGNRIILCRMLDSDISKFSFESACKGFQMFLENVVNEDPTVAGYVFVPDMSTMSMALVTKSSISSIKKYLMYIQEALPLRMKKIHVINTLSFIDAIMTLVRPFMKKELTDMLEFHSGKMENFYSHVPKSLLPKDYGGDLPVFPELSELVKMKLKSNKEFFKEVELLKCDESKRQGVTKTDGQVFGVDGSFKKLNID